MILFGCKVGAKNIMHTCGIYVVGAFVTILEFNLDETVVNSDGHMINE
jgi:hypothetical protein